jgi:hypothetical protein
LQVAVNQITRHLNRHPGTTALFTIVEEAEEEKEAESRYANPSKKPFKVQSSLKDKSRGDWIAWCEKCGLLEQANNGAFAQAAATMHTEKTGHSTIVGSQYYVKT